MTRRIITVIALLALIWLLFSPKSYGQSKLCTERIYRQKWGLNVKYVEDTTRIVIPPNATDKTPLVVMINGVQYVAYRGKVYKLVNKKK